MYKRQVVHAGGWLSATVSGGQGDDIITISEGLAQGDDGDDRIGHYSLEAATLEGGDGNDTIESGYESGTRALGGAGDDIVRDFMSGKDKLDLSALRAIDDFADLIANHVSDNGDDLLIAITGSSEVTIENTSIADLNQNDFIF